MTAFDTAAAVPFDDPNHAVDATYTPFGGAPLAVKAVKIGPRQAENIVGLSRASAPITKIRLLAAALPGKPPRESTIVIGATTYTIEAAQPAFRGLVWECDVRS
jgi:hypothetical protein